MGADRTAAPAPLFGGRVRQWGQWFAAVWLVFLVPVFLDAVRAETLWSEVGALVLVSFAVAYLLLTRALRAVFREGVEVRPALVAAGVVTMVALAAVAVLTLGGDGLSVAPYLTVVVVMLVGTRVAVPVVLVLAAAVELAARSVRGWDQADGIGYSVLGAGFAMWGVLLMAQRNREFQRTEQARSELALASERNRFGRDLHDILGHSLTVITVKAELAGRLAESDDSQARQRVRAELADLERLSRDALADVRRTVEGYREITLAGELARARAALEAAGIRAEVSSAADAAPSDLRELFAWTVREGVTNVVRHSGARTCTVTVDERSVRIEDDGAGSEEVGQGNGLRGLSERASAAGARLLTRSVAPHGFSLTVEASP